MDKDIFRKIKKQRMKLEESIEKNGIDSNETRKLSDKIDELINEYEQSIKIVEYPKNSEMLRWYKKSYVALKKITEDFKKFPSVEEWNLYAKNNNFLSHVSMEYISKLNWNYLKIKIERELNFKVVKKP